MSKFAPWCPNRGHDAMCFAGGVGRVPTHVCRSVTPKYLGTIVNHGQL